MLSVKYLLSRIAYFEDQPHEVLAELLTQVIQHAVEGADDHGISVITVDGLLDLVDEHLQ
ncbi:hypothetical protein [Nocardia sp. NPDC051570]|uniref:hypothetical protein n=1 Tax=Nocardia sp. NPDC051570 TaxID=3364324 RepID=UPI003796988C